MLAFTFIAPTLYVHTYICGVNLETHLHQDVFTGDSQKLHLHILVVARQLELLARRILQPHGITPPQYNVLRILRGQKGQPIAVQSLAARMVNPASNTSRIIDKLVNRGWADRQVCPTDRRRANVLITEAGLSLLEELDTPMSGLFSNTMAGLSERQLTTLNAGLAQVLDNTDGELEQQS